MHHEKCQADEAQAGIKIARRNIDNLRYADDTTLIAESEENLPSESGGVIQHLPEAGESDDQATNTSLATWSF